MLNSEEDNASISNQWIKKKMVILDMLSLYLSAFNNYRGSRFTNNTVN